MKHQIFLLVAIYMSFNLQAQDYPLIYENDFEEASSINHFEFTDKAAWQMSDSLDNQYLELFGKSNYQARVRSPFNIAMLKTVQLGSFILEVDLKQTGKEYGHRDMCLFFGMKDPTNFYYVHIASVADENANNIFLVNDEPRRNIASKTTKGTDWGDGWNKVRIEHNVESGSIKVFFNNMKEPIMEATDNHFNGGFIGFGSFDDTGRIDNIKLWGENLEETEGFFK